MNFLIGKLHIRAHASATNLRLVVGVVCLAWFGGCTSNALRRGAPYDRNRVRKGRYVRRDFDYRKSYRLNRKRIMAVVKGYKGTPYCLGGMSRTCMDCSGLVKIVYKRVNGAKLPRTVAKQYRLGKPVPKGQLKVGDLVFFREGVKRPGHVGIYVGRKKFAHASTSVGVTITKMSDSYFRARYMGARRLFQ